MAGIHFLLIFFRRLCIALNVCHSVTVRQNILHIIVDLEIERWLANFDLLVCIKLVLKPLKRLINY